MRLVGKKLSTAYSFLKKTMKNRLLFLIVAILGLALVTGKASAQDNPSPDSYEPDDSPAQATVLQSGALQQRTIYPDFDVDWVKLNMDQGQTGIAETRDLSGSNPHTVIEVYDGAGNLVAYSDDPDTASGSTVEWDVVKSGDFYVKVRTVGGSLNHFDHQGGGPAYCAYTLWIEPKIVPNDYGYIKGYVTDACNGCPIEGMAVTARASSEKYTCNTSAGHAYLCLVPSGTYDVSASADGYWSYTHNGVFVPRFIPVSGPDATRHFPLVRQSTPCLRGDFNRDAEVDLLDAILAIQFFTQPGAATASQNMDVNCDGKLGMTEILYVLQTCSGAR